MYDMMKYLKVRVRIEKMCCLSSEWCKVWDGMYGLKEVVSDYYKINNINILHKLIKYEIIEVVNSMTPFMCEEGHVDIVKILLMNTKIDPGYNNNRSIWYASRYGHIDIVELLLNDVRVNLHVNDDIIMRWAIMGNYIDMVKLLLKYDPTDDTRSKIDPGGYNNWAIRWASSHGYKEIVKLLMNDKRVSPSDNNNTAIINAYMNHYTEIVELLLTDKNVRLLWGKQIYRVIT